MKEHDKGNHNHSSKKGHQSAGQNGRKTQICYLESSLNIAQNDRGVCSSPQSNKNCLGGGAVDAITCSGNITRGKCPNGKTIYDFRAKSERRYR